jgi:tetratricopeptide (TPR) repeat protein
LRDDAERVRDKLLRMALDDMRRADYRGALRRYKRLSGLDPNNPTLHLKIAEISLRLDNKRCAIHEYLTVAALFSRDAFDAKAVSLYKQALVVDPTRYDICDLLAAAHQRLGRLGAAMEILQTAAKALEREGRDTQALSYRKKIAQLDPADTASRLELARELQRAGLQNDSVAEYAEIAIEFARRGELERIPGVFETIVQMKPQHIAQHRMTSARLAEGTPSVVPAQSGSPFPGDASLEADSAEVCTCLGYMDSLEKLYRRVAQLYRECSQLA